jgi:hypothetical protein
VVLQTNLRPPSLQPCRLRVKSSATPKWTRFAYFFIYLLILFKTPSNFESLYKKISDNNFSKNPLDNSDLPFYTTFAMDKINRVSIKTDLGF